MLKTVVDKVPGRQGNGFLIYPIKLICGGALSA
jgi:hypothetical protein